MKNISKVWRAVLLSISVAFLILALIWRIGEPKKVNIFYLNIILCFIFFTFANISKILSLIEKIKCLRKRY